MQQAKKEGRKGRGGFGSGFGGGMSSQDYSRSGYPSMETQSYDSVPKSTYSQPRHGNEACNDFKNIPRKPHFTYTSAVLQVVLSTDHHTLHVKDGLKQFLQILGTSVTSVLFIVNQQFSSLFF